jgi:hypothetical protein
VKVSADVLSLAASGGRVWVLEQRCFAVTKKGYSTENCARPVLLTGPADGDSLSPVVNQPPGFSSESGGYGGEFVLAGSHVEVPAGIFSLDITTNSGRTWRRSQYPCRSLYATSDRQPGSIGLDPSGSLWLICSQGPTAGYEPKQPWRCIDGAQRWFGPYRLESLGYADTVVPVSSTEAWRYGGRSQIYHSNDGEHSWKAMLGSFANYGGPQAFGVFGLEDAWVVAPQEIDTPFPAELWRMTDGGRAWAGDRAGEATARSTNKPVGASQPTPGQSRFGALVRRAVAGFLRPLPETTELDERSLHEGNHHPRCW